MTAEDKLACCAARMAGTLSALKTAFTWLEMDKKGAIKAINQNLKEYQKANKEYWKSKGAKP